MIYKVYCFVLRLPKFRGKSRLEKYLREHLRPRPSRVPIDFKMFLDPLEWTQITLLSGQATEPKTAQLFERLLHPGDVYVDIGAHVGFLTLVARKCIGAEGQVIAVEPQPYNCEKILTNWQANSFENLVLHVALAGAKSVAHVRLHNQSASDKARLSVALPSPTICVKYFVCRW